MPALVKIVSKGPYEPRYLDVNAGVETYVCIPTENAFIEWYYDKSTLSATDYRTAYNIVTGQEGTDMTPKADKSGLVGQGVPFERIRRITGYLVGDN